MDDVKMPELLPCPFCGSKKIEVMYLYFRPYIICEKCHAQIPCYNNYKDAKKAWNRRTEKNEPLTIDELTAMDGMPVWVEFEPDVTGEQLTMWALIEVTDTIMLTNNLRGRSELLDDMTVEGWRVKVYRRKPKEER